jgi:hypothetical protein
VPDRDSQVNGSKPSKFSAVSQFNGNPNPLILQKGFVTPNGSTTAAVRSPRYQSFRYRSLARELPIYSGCSIVRVRYGREAEHDRQSDVAESLLHATVTREFQCLQTE